MVFAVAVVGAKPEFGGAIVLVDIMEIDIDLQENGKVKMTAVIITVDCLPAS